MRPISAVHLRFGVVLLISVACYGQPAQQDRVTQRIDNSIRSTIQHNVHPRTRSAIDRGPVEGSLEMQRITMVFKPSQTQQAELDALLQSQQDSGSPSYHKWLTPELY